MHLWFIRLWSIMLLMRAASFMRASGWRLGPGNRDFFGPCEMHRADRRVPFGAQKSRDFQGPIPLAWPPPSYPSNGCFPHQKCYVQNRINHKCIGGFMYKIPWVVSVIKAPNTPPVRLSNIFSLVRLSNKTALIPPPSPHPELIRNQQETVRCVKERSST